MGNLLDDPAGDGMPALLDEATCECDSILESFLDGPYLSHWQKDLLGVEPSVQAGSHTMQLLIAPGFG